MGAIVSSSGSDHIIHDQPPTSNLNGITESKIRTIQDGGNRLYSHDRENRMILPPSLPHSPVISSYSLLLALPRELLYLAYSFLDWSSYGHLDLAMTSHLLRPHYLATLNGMITPLRFLYSHPYSNVHHSHLRWIISRNVLPLHITILRDADLYLFLALILRVRSRLIALYIYGTSSFPQEYLFSIGSCPCLTKFELYLPSNSISPQQLGQFLQQNPQIQKLKFHVAAPYPPNIVSIIRDNCPNLKYLYLPKNKVWLNDHCISELVRGPKIPNLQALSLSCCRLSEQSIQLMMDSFPNLHYFTFDRVLNSEEGMMLSCLQRIVHKALIDDNVETRMLGMRCLVTYSSRSKKRGGNDVTLEELELQLSCTNVVYDATLFLLGKKHDKVPRLFINHGPYVRLFIEFMRTPELDRTIKFHPNQDALVHHFLIERFFCKVVNTFSKSGDSDNLEMLHDLINMGLLSYLMDCVDKPSSKRRKRKMRQVLDHVLIFTNFMSSKEEMSKWKSVQQEDFDDQLSNDDRENEDDV